MFVLGVCFRGPSPPATRMPLSVQLENARLAGAEAVIFINHDPAVSDLGAVEYSQEDLCAVSQGPLPMGVVLNTSCKMLRVSQPARAGAFRSCAFLRGVSARNAQIAQLREQVA